MSKPATPSYNERAWAIDVISAINAYSAKRLRAIARAGGEHTVAGLSGSLFPDVLLFGDSSGALVQQGWELKMPDTAITDTNLLSNAEQKALRLGLNSFVVWNVNEAALYIEDGTGKFKHEKSWGPIGVKRRPDVASSRSVWLELLHQIIDDLNDLFDYGKTKGASPEAAINDTLFLEYLHCFTPSLSQQISQSFRKNASFAAELDTWWSENSVEHPGCGKFEGLARVSLINWINRFLFSHYLKRFNHIASAVDSIKPGVSVKEALLIFQKISASCDFMNIFNPALGQEHLDIKTWDGLVNLNAFLTDFRLETISQDSFHKVIDVALSYSRKKLAGQFSTPKPLADLLVRLTIEDRTKPVIDPCCGTGTIPRAAYDLQRSIGAGVDEALANVWASDKFAFPLQLCSIALSDPLGMGEVVQVFRHDAFELTNGQPVVFVDPGNGDEIVRNLPFMHAVVSNLPFVRFEDNETLNPSLGQIRSNLAKDCSAGIVFDGRADLYAYLVLKLRDLVEDHGRIGVICSNSWLGVEWGKQFRKILFNCFKIKQVVVSGEGRWFSNADVVTTILVLEKKASGINDPNEIMAFVTTTNRIETWEKQPGGIERLASHILVGKKAPIGYTKQQYTQTEIALLESVGIGWNALFSDLFWLSAVSQYLVPVKERFVVSRGERRGWDKLFYPEDGHGIEKQYIKPVLKSARDIRGLIASPDNEAFCCSDSIDELKKKRMAGALNWISIFERAVNGTNRPLPEVLARSDCEWYEMSPATLADLVISMNPDKRICVHRLAERSFVNQRLIRFTTSRNVDVDVDICHALMNSVIGMFLIEAVGFGRGLGALDLNSTKISDRLHMLDPDVLTKTNRHKILLSFNKLLNRDIYDLTKELNSEDRIAFDYAVLNSFGLGHLQKQIYASLRHLYHLRQTAKTV